MNLIPIGKHILIKPDVTVEEKTESGLIFKSDKEIKQEWGVIVAVGKEVEDRGEFSVGDRICWKAFLPDEVDFEGQRYLLGIKDDIICKEIEN